MRGADRFIRLAPFFEIRPELSAAQGTTSFGALHLDATAFGMTGEVTAMIDGVDLAQAPLLASLLDGARIGLLDRQASHSIRTLTPPSTWAGIWPTRSGAIVFAHHKVVTHCSRRHR